MNLPTGEALIQPSAPSLGMVESLLAEILAELRMQRQRSEEIHAYCVERDKLLDSLDERDAFDREEKAIPLMAALERMNRIVDKLEHS